MLNQTGRELETIMILMAYFPGHQPGDVGVHELVQSPRGAGGAVTAQANVSGRRDAGRPLRAGARRRWPLGWLRRNLFSSRLNTVLTLVVLGLLALALPPLFRWAVTNATISGATKAACGPDGACWTFIRVRLPTFFYRPLPGGRALAGEFGPAS